MTLKVICRLQAFSSAIRRTFVQHSTRFQLTACSRAPSATAGLLVFMRVVVMLIRIYQSPPQKCPFLSWRSSRRRTDSRSRSRAGERVYRAPPDPLAVLLQCLIVCHCNSGGNTESTRFCFNLFHCPSASYYKSKFKSAGTALNVRTHAEVYLAEMSDDYLSN